jgi:predicted alpha/beta hydrolase family esterase
VGSCHSLACLLWFHSAASITEELRPDRLLLVSPPDSDQVPDSGAEFRLRDLDSAAVDSSVRVELRTVASDADPYSLRGAQTSYGDLLGVEVEVVSGAGHITPKEEGLSRQEIIRRAILDRYERAGHAKKVADSTDRMVERWGDVLDRLGSV